MQKYVLFIGIDISKKWIDVCLSQDGRKKSMSHIQVNNDDKGFAEMLRFIRKSKEYHKDRSSWLFLMEHTGVYSMPLCEYLEKKDFQYCMLNPLDLKYSLGIKRGKSDKVDAADITRYGYKNRDELVSSKLPSRNLLKIKALISFRRRLVKQKSAIKVAAKELSRFTCKKIHADVKRMSDENTKLLQAQILETEKEIKRAIASDDELSRLHALVTSVKGAGLIISASMLVYTVGFTAFKTARPFAVYIGLVPFGHRSGTSVNAPARVSHLAHKKLKGDISCGASVATNHDKEMKAYYEKRISEGKNKFIVQNIMRNKFINRIFAVVKRGTPYIELGQHKA